MGRRIVGLREKAVQLISMEKADGLSGLLQKSLSPFALVYQGATVLRSSLYAHDLLASRRLSRPVISVGNLVTGGTGKTPLVIGIVRHLSARGIRFAVLSRGYKGKAKQAVNVVSDTDGVYLDARMAGDEPNLIALKLPGTPVLVGRDRFALGKEAVRRFDVDCLILDDGFQHLSLKRECNLLLLDGIHPFGNGRCLPSGTLREGSSALRRADVIVTAGVPSKEAAALIHGLAPGKTIHVITFAAGGIKRFPSGEAEDLSMLQGKRVLAFSGIARPERFYRSLEDAGAVSCIRRTFPDHHPYTPQEIRSLFQEGVEKGADCLVTTEKDMVRLPDIPEAPPLFSLQLSAEARDPEEFFGAILACIGMQPQQRA